MSRLSMVLGVLAFFGLSCGAAGDDKPKPGDDDPKKALSFPGPDADAVVAFLERIQKGRADAERATGDLLIRGRVSDVRLGWKDGMADQTAATLPAPEWCQFLLVHKGRKRRYDQEYAHELPGSEHLATVYRLMDGRAFYKLDLNALEILDAEREQETWEGLAAGYFSYSQAYDGRHYGPVSVVCRTLVGQVKEGKDAECWRGRVLRCYEEDGLLVVEITTGAKSKYRFTFWVDPKRGYQVVRRRDERGGSGQNVHYREECRIELAEAASSVFLPKRATMFFFDIGSVAKKDGRAGWVRSDMEAFRMKVGKIDYADWLFDVASLPVPKDVQVSDHRKRREAR